MATVETARRTNPYLSGNFGPIRTEDDFLLPVTGALPPDLAGTLYRIGPNPRFEPRDENHHWFIGDGMVHAFHVGNGEVRYRNRWSRTPKWLAEDRAGRSLFGTFGNPATTDPSVLGCDSGVANTNIIWHAGKLLALEEGHKPFALDPLTLESKGYWDFAGRLPGRFTAHPKEDPETGELVFFGYSDDALPFSKRMSFGVIDRAGVLVRHEYFEAPYASMVHDFIVTRNYVLFPILPLSGSMERAMKGLPPYAWEPEKPALVGVMRRDAGAATIRWFETAPCYVFHPMNGWDDGDRITAEVMQYAVAPLFPNADGSPGAPAQAHLTRWTIDLKDVTNTVRAETLDDLSGEFPRLDERRTGLSYRHGYFAAHSRRDDRVAFNMIAHIDLKTGARRTYAFGAADGVSEPVFTPRGPNEGEGWLLAVVFRGAENRSDLVVLDAEDVAAGPVAVAAVPRRVPYGFHGNWRPA